MQTDAYLVMGPRNLRANHTVAPPAPAHVVKFSPSLQPAKMFRRFALEHFKVFKGLTEAMQLTTYSLDPFRHSVINQQPCATVATVAQQRANDLDPTVSKPGSETQCEALETCHIQLQRDQKETSASGCNSVITSIPPSHSPACIA